MRTDVSPAAPPSSEVEARDDAVAPSDRQTVRTGALQLVTRTGLPLALVTCVYVVLVKIAAMPLGNYDTYFHLRFGHEFLTGAWDLQDPGSVSTYATSPWVPTQWLPQVVMAQVEEWFGLAGVAWLAGLQFLGLGLAVFVVVRRWANPLVSALVLVVTLAACTPGMSMRPQVLSYILVVVTSAAWLRASETRTAPWFLVPLTWLWAMCHGMWPVGIAIGLVAVVGMLLDRRASRPALVRLLAVPVASAVAACLTPVGPGLFKAVLLVNSRGAYFSEWGPPDFTEYYSVALLALLAAAIVPLLRAGRTDWFTILMVGLAAGWAVYSLRTVPVAACLVAPFAAAAVQRAVGSSPGRSSRPERVFVVGGFATALVVLALLVPTTSAQPLAQPAWADPALGSLPEGTKVLNESGPGGFLMWRYPNLDLVSSGYGDTFTEPELRRMVAIEQLLPGWDDEVRDTGVQYAVLDPESQLGYALVHQEDWAVIHEDRDLVLLRPPVGWMSGDEAGR